MSAVVSSLSPTVGSTTADDTLKQTTRHAGVIPAGPLVAKALKNEGVDTIFTLCGGHIIDIDDDCVDEGIRNIDVRHEQVAAHAADGHARQTGKLGCVLAKRFIGPAARRRSISGSTRASMSRARRTRPCLSKTYFQET